MKPVLVDFFAQELKVRRAKRDTRRNLALLAQPKQIVILDTNTLFTKNDEHIFSSASMKTVSECRKYTSIKLVIPRVVLLERLFQKLFATSVRYKKVRRELKLLGNIIQYRLEEYDTPTDLARHFYRRVIRWCHEHSVTVVRAPLASINWHRLVCDAIWRKPPFSPYDPDIKTEKGFRDALILETVTKIIQDSISSSVAFICHDKLLRDTAKARNSHVAAFSVHATLEDFLSSVKLANKDISALLANVLVHEAPQIFYDEMTSESIFSIFDIPKRIQTEFGGYLYHSHSVVQENGYGISKFIPLTEEKIKVGRTAFEFIDERGRYRWQTQIAFGRGFKATEETQDLKIRAALFGANWSCDFDAHGVSSNAALDNIVSHGVLIEDQWESVLPYYNIDYEADRLASRIVYDGLVPDESEGDSQEVHAE